MLYTYEHFLCIWRDKVCSGTSQHVSLHVAPARKVFTRLHATCGWRVHPGVWAFIAKSETLQVVPLFHHHMILYLVEVVAV